MGDTKLLDDYWAKHHQEAKMLFYCECMSAECTKTIELSHEAASDYQSKRLIIIVGNCLHGPEPTDRLVEKRANYSLYEEG